MEACPGPLWPSGSVILITDANKQVCIELILENRGRDCISLARPTAPYHRLVIGQNNKIVFKEANDKSCFVRPVTSSDDATIVAFKSTCRDVYIGFSATGDLEATLIPTFHRVSMIPSYYETKQAQAGVSKQPIGDDDNNGAVVCNSSSLDSDGLLSREQYQHFYHYGFLQLSKAVSRHKIDNCVKLLNHYLGVPGSIVAGGIQGNDLGKFEGGITRRREILRLIEGQLTNIIEKSLLCTAGNIDKSTSNLQVQVAFRFPELNSYFEHLSASAADIDMDVDLSSVAWHTDGLRQGRAHSFSLLVGVCLADIDQPLAGNLLIWPRTHKLLHACKINEYGALDMEKLRCLIDDEGFDCRKILSIDEQESIFQANYASRQLNTRTNTIPGEADISANPEINGNHISSNHDIIHDNEPASLPSLGRPVSLLMKAGVRPYMRTVYATSR